MRKTRKVILLLFAITVLLLLTTGCSEKEKGRSFSYTPSPSPFPVLDTPEYEGEEIPVLEDDFSSMDGFNDFNYFDSSYENEDYTISDDPDAIVDLTALSSTMVYAEVFNMMMEPERYIGRTIKMKGLYYASYYDVTRKYYHYVIITDAAACCVQGLEFVWLGEHTYPDDYPEDDTEIEVTGVFKSYDEENITFYYIETDAIIIP